MKNKIIMNLDNIIKLQLDNFVNEQVNTKIIQESQFIS